MEYLLEYNLIEVLNKIYPGIEWVHNKSLPGYRIRPDYRSEQIKLIVEFDGPRHYTSARCCIQDINKDIIYNQNGYKVIRIPYFVQLDSNIIQYLFNKSVIVNSYPQGFISNDKTLVYPADYCELGLNRFKKDLIHFQTIELDIINSLKEKIKKEGAIDIVLPPSLNYLLNKS